LRSPESYAGILGAGSAGRTFDSAAGDPGGIGCVGTPCGAGRAAVAVAEVSAAPPIIGDVVTGASAAPQCTQNRVPG
jgi:hypothetical protein